jgi:hypothetical protein
VRIAATMKGMSTSAADLIHGSGPLLWLKTHPSRRRLTLPFAGLYELPYNLAIR